MFGEQFYPTPLEFGKKIILDNEKDNQYFYAQKHRVLDPSAGKGDFFAAFKAAMQASRGKQEAKEDRYFAEPTVKTFAIEIDPNLQHVLLGNGHNVIDTDFLEHHGHAYYDYVIMNPPFAKGASHLLHAWHSLQFKKLICILNASTIENPHSNKRKAVVELIERHGRVVFYDNAFSDAERQTDVRVAVVYLEKKQGENIFDDPTIDRAAHEATKKQINAGAEPLTPARRDVIGNLVKQYNATIQQYIVFRQEAMKMQRLEDLFDWHTGKERLKDSDSASNIKSPIYSDGKHVEQLADFVDRLTQAAWQTVFRLTKIESKMTEKVKRQVEESKAKVGAMAFTEKNVYTVLSLLMDNTGDMMTQACLDVFDYFTKYHEENRVYFEGWKSNNAFEISRKVVLPHVIGINYSGYYEVRLSSYYGRDTDISDVDKAMCFLTGKQYMGCEVNGQRVEGILTIRDAVRAHSRAHGVKGEFESEFFKIRIFKKGTIHLTFKDQSTLDRLNQIAAKGRGWLKAWEAKNGKGKGVVLFQE